MEQKLHNQVTLAAILSLGLCGLAAGGGNDAPIQFADVQWQSAERSDMALFEPYIGTFRGETFKSDTDGTEFYFTIEYEWYDREQSAVKFTVQMHVPARDETHVLGEGFYHYDPFLERIAVVGVFKDGRTGSGYVSPFDMQTHAREVRIHARTPDGAVNEIRDTFSIIDDDSWRNLTYVSTDGGEWRVVSDGVYTRVRG